MSTRSQFGFYKKDTIDILKTRPYTMLYKHWDGYPTGNLPLIFSFLKRYFFDEVHETENSNMKITKHGIDYFSAWFLYYIINDHIKRNKKMNKDYKYSISKPRDGMDLLGYSIDKNMHSDIEYYYAFTPNYLIAYDICPSYSTSTVIFKALIKDLVLASYLKTTKTYHYDIYELYFPKDMDDKMLSTIHKFMKNPKTRNIMEVFDYVDDHKNRTIDIGYQIINALDMPHEDLPTMISNKSPLINALVKCRLDHNI